jgi:hypothetical protein
LSDSEFSKYGFENILDALTSADVILNFHADGDSGDTSVPLEVNFSIYLLRHMFVHAADISLTIASFH